MSRTYRRRSLIFAAVTVVFAILSVVGLTQNGRGAVERYDRLIATDQAGGDVEAALNDLRTYIYAHMNSEIGGGANAIYPPIQLSGTYDRLLRAEEARVQDSNSVLYEQAQLFCEQNGSQGFSGSARLACVNDYVAANGAQVQPVDDALYKFDFVAPRWSPDLAGFSVIGLVMSFLATVFYVARHMHIKRVVRRAH